MNFALSEEHELLRETARRFVDEEVDHAPLLRPGATVEQAGYDAIWPKIAALGWPGMVLPEAYGGLGMSYIDLVMVIGEMGRTVAATPLFGTIAGAWVIEKAGSEVQKAKFLTAVAEGNLKLAFAAADADGRYDAPTSGAIARRVGDGFVISGSKSFVVDARAADKLVVVATLEGVRSYFIADAKAPEVALELLQWRDITRQVCQVTFTSAHAERLEASDDHVWPWVRDRLYLMLSAESAALARTALDDAVAYAKERVAFGRPIGAFQAIKHQLAYIAGIVEGANALVQYAAWTLSEGDPNAALAAAMAQSYASDVAREATHRNIQVFGAIGFTWEMKNHLYYKRARCNAELLGQPAKQRTEVIGMLKTMAA